MFDFNDFKAAIENNDYREIELILESNPDLINEDDGIGTGLSIASRFADTDIIELLLSSGANVNQASGFVPSTPINDAATRGSVEVVRLLVDNGAEINSSEYLNNPLFTAIFMHKFNVAKYLINAGIDLSTKYEIHGRLYDAKEWAIKHKCLEVLKLIEEQ